MPDEKIAIPEVAVQSSVERDPASGQHTTMESAGAQVSQIVNLKLPQFYTDSPDAWFSYAEAQFNLKRISSQKTRYDYVISSLPTEVANRVIDLIRNIPAENPYDAVKARLYKIYALSDIQKCEKLISLPGLGDQTPSELLDKMLMYLPETESMDCIFFKFMYLRRLPADLQLLLTNRDFLSLRELAQQADRLWDQKNSGLVTRACMMEEVAEEAEVTAVSSLRLCRLHFKFGSSAKRCEKPCAWSKMSGNAGAGGRR